MTSAVYSLLIYVVTVNIIRLFGVSIAASHPGYNHLVQDHPDVRMWVFFTLILSVWSIAMVVMAHMYVKIGIKHPLPSILSSGMHRRVKDEQDLLTTCLIVSWSLVSAIIVSGAMLLTDKPATAWEHVPFMNTVLHIQIYYSFISTCMWIIMMAIGACVHVSEETEDE
jgi:uncharacterized Tic20 family protein